MKLILIALPVMILAFLYAINKSKSIFPIIIIMGLTLLFGIVNGAGGYYGTLPSAFASYFDNNQYIRVLGSLLLSVIYLHRYGFKIPDKGIFGLLLIYPIMMFIYFIGTQESGFSDGILGTIIKLSDVIGFYLLIQAMSFDYNIKRYILKSIAILGVFFIIINLVAIFLEPSNSFRALRFRGIAFSVNWMGAYLSLILIPLIAQYFLSDKKKMIWLFFIVADLILIILTGSRASLLATFFYILSFILFSGKQNEIKIKASSILILLFLFTLLILSIMSIYPEWFSFVNDRLTSTIDTRSGVYAKFYDIWYNNGFFLGLSSEIYSVESVYVSSLYVYGLVGLSIFILILLVIIYKIFNITRNNISLTTVCGISIFFGYIIHSFFESFYFGSMSAFNLFFYIGLAMVFSENHIIHNNKEDNA